MTIKIVAYDSPAPARAVAEGYLARDPRLSNLVLTLLAARVDDPQPGRYWVAFDGTEVVGVSLQSPLDRPLLLSAASPGIAAALAAAISAEARELPGVLGEAHIAARFAGQWTEQRRVGAHPVGAQRLYAADVVGEGREVPGAMEQATREDEALIREWMGEFSIEVGEPAIPSPELVQRRISDGEIWTWRDGVVRGMAAATPPILGTSRVQAVYTPPGDRRKGYAEGLVRSLTRHLLGGGIRPILYADLANPTSNAIYRRIGYQAIAEIVRYRFEAHRNRGR
jgi:predicted GNAT family acetyltransferase